MAPKLSKNKGGKASKSDRDEGLSASEDHEEVKLVGVTQNSEAESSDAETPKESNPANLDNILQAIISLKSEFSAKFESVLTILTDVKNQIGDCSARLTEAEGRISQTEDNVNKLQSTAKMLEDKIKSLKQKIWKIAVGVPTYGWWGCRRKLKAETRVAFWKIGFLTHWGWNIAFR